MGPPSAAATGPVASRSVPTVAGLSRNRLEEEAECPNEDELRAKMLAHWRDVERRAVALPQIVPSRGPVMSLHQVTGGVDWRAVRAIAAEREPGRVARGWRERVNTARGSKS